MWGIHLAHRGAVNAQTPARQAFRGKVPYDLDLGRQPIRKQKTRGSSERAGRYSRYSSDDDTGLSDADVNPLPTMPPHG